MLAVVQAEALVKSYPTRRGTITAVAGIDLEIEAGEFVAICGRSGSGKSTLLGMLGGLCRPTSGEVRVDGVPLASLGAGGLATFRARRFGFMFQFAGLLPTLRALDNVALPALLGGVNAAEANERARELLSQVGLGQRWDAYPWELSGGQQRRVAVARALVNEPGIVFADEPTNDLDELAEQEILALLIDLHKTRNRSLIIVTHDRELVRRADRTLTLRAGRVVSSTLSEPALVGSSPGIAPGVSSLLPEGESTSRPFEEEAAGLVPADETPLGAGLGRFLFSFVGWALVFACAMYGVNLGVARLQTMSLATRTAERKKSEELALQQLRADIQDVSSEPDGSYRVSIYLQNFRPQQPFYVLGPKLSLFVQINQSWQPIAAMTIDGQDRAVHAIADKQVFPMSFRADFDRFDELIRGYMHVRISNAMIVSASREANTDLFERNDDYYIYLKPQNLPDDEVRRRNGWKPGALVPRWIAMPSH